MPLLDLESAPSAADITAQAVMNIARSAYDSALYAQKLGTALIWNNPEGLTPQQAVDALGSKASGLFTLHGLLTDFVVQSQSEAGKALDIALPTNNFTKNPDGTVTILPTPYSQP